MKALNKAFAAMAILAAFGVGGTVASGAAWADRGDCGGRCACSGREGAWREHGHRGAMIAKALGLSGEQRAQIKAIFRKHHDEIAPLRRKMVTERRELRTLAQADKPDEAALREQAKKISATTGDLAVLRARISGEVRSVLTPEQVQKFRAMQEKRDRRIDRMMNRGDERHPGEDKRSNGD